MKPSQKLFQKYSPLKLRNYVKKLVPKKVKDQIWYSLATLKPWEELELNPPQSLKFETTNICNANCTFCGYQYQDRKKGVMSLDLYKESLDQYIQMGGDSIGFTPVVGDPLVDPHIIERIQIANRSSKIKSIYFHTNGILLSKKNLATELLTSGLKALHISTAGFDSEMFQRVYRSSKYSDMLKGVHELLKKNKELGEPLEINLELRADKPIEQVFQDPDYLRYIKPYIPNSRTSWITEFDSWGGMITPDQLTGTMKLAPPPSIKKRPCSRTFSAMIMWDGQVRACSCRFKVGSFNELVIGDLTQNSLKEIWYGFEAKSLRRSFVKGELAKVCQSCTWYEPI